MVGSAADTDVEVVLDLTAENVGIGPLGGQDQVDAEGSSLSGDHGQSAFDFANDLLLILRQTGFVQHLSHLVAGKDVPGQILTGSFVVPVNVGLSVSGQELFSSFQFFRQFRKQFQGGLLLEAHPAFLMPDRREVHTALEVSDTNLSTLFLCLHEQQLQQDTLAAAGSTAQEDVGDLRQIHSHRASEALTQS